MEEYRYKASFMIENKKKKSNYICATIIVFIWIISFILFIKWIYY